MGVESVLQIELGGPFDRGRGGPGGWRVLVEPEIHFVRDREICVPDLAGWRRERLPKLPQDQRFEIVPDWICEILSPSTESKDRQIKMPIYAHYGIRFAWLIDPLKQTVEAFMPSGVDWTPLVIRQGTESAALPPFEAVPLDLAGLWR